MAGIIVNLVDFAGLVSQAQAQDKDLKLNFLKRVDIRIANRHQGRLRQRIRGLTRLICGVQNTG